MGFRIYYEEETWVLKMMKCYKICEEIVGGSKSNGLNIPLGKREYQFVQSELLKRYLLLFEFPNPTSRMTIALKRAWMWSVAGVEIMVFQQ